MKSSELIKELTKQISENGDHEVIFLNENYEIVTSVSLIANLVHGGESYKLETEVII